MIARVLGIVGGIILLTIVVLALGPAACTTARSVAYVPNHSFDGRVEEAAYRGAARAIKPHHDETMAAHRTAQDTLSGIASCMDCKGKKPAPAAHPANRHSASPAAAKAEPTTGGDEDSYLKIEARGQASVILAKKITKNDDCCNEPPVTNPCNGCNEQHHEAAPVRREPERRAEPCGKNLFHWGRKSCTPKPPKTDNCDDCSKPGGSRAR